jgi:hypothetical protein
MVNNMDKLVGIQAWLLPWRAELCTFRRNCNFTVKLDKTKRNLMWYVCGLSPWIHCEKYGLQLRHPPQFPTVLNSRIHQRSFWITPISIIT